MTKILVICQRSLSFCQKIGRWFAKKLVGHLKSNQQRWLIVLRYHGSIDHGKHLWYFHKHSLLEKRKSPIIQERHCLWNEWPFGAYCRCPFRKNRCIGIKAGGTRKHKLAWQMTKILVIIFQKYKKLDFMGSLLTTPFKIKNVIRRYIRRCCIWFVIV